jgi:hypothetical protein
VLQVPTSVPPDFLSSLLALAYIMRLSVMKAAQAALGSVPCRKSGPWAEQDGRSPSTLFCGVFLRYGGISNAQRYGNHKC